MSPTQSVPASTHGELIVAGSTNIGELNSRYELKVPEEEYTTIGGYVFGALGRVPAVGDRVTAGGAMFIVREMDGRRVETLSMEIVPMPRTLAPRSTNANESPVRTAVVYFLLVCRSTFSGALAPASLSRPLCAPALVRSTSGIIASSYAFTAITVATCSQIPNHDVVVGVRLRVVRVIVAARVS